MPDGATGPAQGPICVFCRRKAVAPEWRPFCSERCKLRDLANWADGRYAIPGLDDEDESEQEEEKGNENL